MNRSGALLLSRALASVLAIAACDRQPTAPLEENWDGTVSNALPGSGTPFVGIAFTRFGTGIASQVSPSDEIVYVSLPAGTIPRGGLATVRNPRNGIEVAAAFSNGGFDPVAIPAEGGERLDLEVLLVGGGSRAYSVPVPLRRLPRIVRTNPVPQKRDVPLNSRFTVVFSEPIQPSTASGIRLLQAGAPVSGQVELSSDGLRAIWMASQLLAPNTDYVLDVPGTITDLSGDALEQPASFDMTTGTAITTALVATEEPAVLLHQGRDRAIVFHASLQEDGSVSGTYTLFYPDDGFTVWGSISCFSTSGPAAWIAGRVDSSSSSPIATTEQFWRTVDAGPATGGVPDSLSLAFTIHEGSSSSALEWCATRPLTDPWYGEVRVHPLVGGDVMVMGHAPPPPLPEPSPPPAPGTGQSLIALFSPGRSIQVTTDGSQSWVLTDGPNDYNPVWSPDGTRLAFQRHRDDGGSDIWVMNWDGSGLTRLTDGTHGDRDPAWSPDGTRLAFERNGSIHMMNADGGGVTSLSSTGSDSRPHWSPDGQRIVFGGRRSERFSIYVMDVEAARSSEEYIPTRLTDAAADDWSPSWSPDGQRIVFKREEADRSHIYVMNADGSALTRVAAGQMPSWSPDGRRIIYELFGITYAFVDGSAMTRIGRGFGPVWQPVGTLPPETTPFRSIEMVDGDGQSGTTLTTLPQPLRVRVVSDDGEPQPNVTICWNVWWNFQWPDGTVGPRLSVNVAATTDANGMSAVSLTLGSAIGPVHVRAAVVDGTARRGEVMFTLIGIAP